MTPYWIVKLHVRKQGSIEFFHRKDFYVMAEGEEKAAKYAWKEAEMEGYQPTGGILLNNVPKDKWEQEQEREMEKEKKKEKRIKALVVAGLAGAGLGALLVAFGFATGWY